MTGQTPRGGCRDTDTRWSQTVRRSTALDGFGDPVGPVSILGDDLRHGMTNPYDWGEESLVVKRFVGVGMALLPRLGGHVKQAVVRTTSSRPYNALARSGVCWGFSSCRHPFRRQWHVAGRRHGW